MTCFARNVLCFFMLVVLGSCSAQAAEIRLLPVVQANKPILRLGDIARVKDQDPLLAKRLTQLELIASPSPGRKRRLRVSEIRELLTLRGVDFRKHRMSGALTVNVTTPATPTSFRAAQSSPPTTVLPKAPVRRIQSTRRHEPAAVAPAESMRAVLVTNRPIRRNEVIRPQDVRLATKKASKSNDAFDEPGQVLGLVAVRAMPSNFVIKSRDVKRPLLVRRSDIVTLVVRVGTVRVSTSVKALEDGAQDEVVSVESVDRKSRQRFAARVVGHQQVEILTGGAAPPASTRMVNSLRTGAQGVRR